MDERQYDRYRSDERDAAERSVRAGIEEVRSELQKLETRCREGRITRSEWEEVREVLELQQRYFAEGADTGQERGAR